VLQCVAVCFRLDKGYTRRSFFQESLCCSVLQCVAVCCRALQCLAERYSALQRVTVYCRALQCVAGRYSVLQGVVVCCRSDEGDARRLFLQHPLCCNALQCVEAHRSAMQCSAGRMKVTRHTYTLRAFILHLVAFG